MFDLKDFLMLRILSYLQLFFSFFFPPSNKANYFNRHFLRGRINQSIIWPFVQYQCAQQQRDAPGRPKLLTALTWGTESIQNKARFIAWGAAGLQAAATQQWGGCSVFPSRPYKFVLQLSEWRIVTHSGASQVVRDAVLSKKLQKGLEVRGSFRRFCILSQWLAIFGLLFFFSPWVTSDFLCQLTAVLLLWLQHSPSPGLWDADTAPLTQHRWGESIRMHPHTGRVPPCLCGMAQKFP